METENLPLPNLRCLAVGLGIPEAQQSVHICSYSPDIPVPLGPVRYAHIEPLPCAYICVYLGRAQRSCSDICHLFSQGFNLGRTCQVMLAEQHAWVILSSQPQALPLLLQNSVSSSLRFSDLSVSTEVLTCRFWQSPVSGACPVYICLLEVECRSLEQMWCTQKKTALTRRWQAAASSEGQCSKERVCVKWSIPFDWGARTPRAHQRCQFTPGSPGTRHPLLPASPGWVRVEVSDRQQGIWGPWDSWSKVPSKALGTFPLRTENSPSRLVFWLWGVFLACSPPGLNCLEEEKN